MNSIWLVSAQNNNLRRMKLCQLANPSFDINTTTSIGQSALMLAIPTKNMKLIKYLIRQGINLNISDRNGENALSLSLRFQNDWLSEYLFEKGCRLTVISPPALNPLQENLRKRIENWKNSKKMIVAYLKNKIKLT